MRSFLETRRVVDIDMHQGGMQFLLRHFLATLAVRPIPFSLLAPFAKGRSGSFHKCLSPLLGYSDTRMKLQKTFHAAHGSTAMETLTGACKPHANIVMRAVAAKILRRWACEDTFGVAVHVSRL